MAYDGFCLVGPFGSAAERDAALSTVLGRFNLKLIDKARFRYGVDRMLPTAETSQGAWAMVSTAFAKVMDASALACELVYDPDDEWGRPIGYDVYELVREGEGFELGPCVREHRGDDVHPDDGPYDGLVEEMRLRAGDAKPPEVPRAYFTWGDAFGDGFLDHKLYAALAGDIYAWRPIEGGYTMQYGLDDGAYRVDLEPADADALARAFEERTGRSLASFDQPARELLGHASRRGHP